MREVAVNDEDLELLEAYLDGECDDEQIQSLRARVSAEPALAQALEQFRAERQMRQQLFKACEPDDITVEALNRAVRIAAHSEALRETVWAGRTRRLRVMSAAAACILFGFFGGWVLHQTNAVNSAQPDQPMAQLLPPPSTDVPGSALVSNDGSPAVPASGFQVLLTDVNGRVVGSQRFGTYDEARRFTEDFRRWQTNRRQQAPGSNAGNPGSDTIFVKEDF
jgi:hypothetical protein